MYSIVLTENAQRQHDALPLRDREKIDNAIGKVAHAPFSGKKLHGQYKGFWSYRVWPYRIIYIIEKKIVTVTVVAIGHRKDIYKRLR